MTEVLSRHSTDTETSPASIGPDEVIPTLAIEYLEANEAAFRSGGRARLDIGHVAFYLVKKGILTVSDLKYVDATRHIMNEPAVPQDDDKPRERDWRERAANDRG